jgi:hypothetical protein
MEAGLHVRHGQQLALPGPRIRLRPSRGATTGGRSLLERERRRCLRSGAHGQRGDEDGGERGRDHDTT